MRGRPAVIEGLSGGVNLIDDADEIAGHGQARDLLNVRSIGNGGWATRQGSALVALTGDDVQERIYFTQGADANDSDVIVSHFSRVSGGSFVVDIAATNLRTGVTAALASESTPAFPFFVPTRIARAPAISSQGPIYISAGPIAGSGKGFTWDGTSGTLGEWTATAGSGDPISNSFGILYAFTRMWSLVPSVDSVYCSDVGDPTNWDTTVNAVQVKFDPDDGEALTAFAVTGDYIVVFKRSKVWVINDQGNSGGANRRLDTKVGTVYPDSLANSPGGLFFLGSDRKVYLTDGNSVKSVSRVIDPLLRYVADPSSSGVFDWSVATSSARAAYWNGSYFLRVLIDHPTLGDVIRLIEYHVETGTWWIHESPHTDLTAGPNGLYGAAADGLHLLFSQDENVDGVVDTDDPFSSAWQSGDLTFGSPAFKKRVRSVHFDGTGSDVTASLGRDGADFADVSLDGSTLKGGRILSPGVARAWAVRVESDAPMSLRSMTWGVDPRGN